MEQNLGQMGILLYIRIEKIYQGYCLKEQYLFYIFYGIISFIQKGKRGNYDENKYCNM